MKGFRRGEKGFTLVELLIVVAILGILAAVVIPNVVGLLGRGGKQAYETDSNTIELGAAAFYSDIHTGWHTGVVVDAVDTPASFMDNVWGDWDAPTDPTIIPGHYFPTAIAKVANHYITVSTDPTETDPAQVNNPLIVRVSDGSAALDEDIQASAIWMGLLVQPYNVDYVVSGGFDGATADADSCARWLVSPLEGENQLYLDEMPVSAMTGVLWNGDPDETSAKSGGYSWIVGQNGQVYGVYQVDDDEWYAGFSGSYP